MPLAPPNHIAYSTVGGASYMAETVPLRARCGSELDAEPIEREPFTISEPVGQVIAIQPAKSRSMMLPRTPTSFRSPVIRRATSRPGSSQSITIETRRPARSCAHSPSQA